MLRCASLRFFIALAMGFMLIGCASSGPAPSISVTITQPSAPATIQQGQTVNITASVVNDSASRGVIWSLVGQGTLSGQTATTVTYNAPASVNSQMTAAVTATSVTNNTKSASITVTVMPPAPASVSVTITNKITSIAAGAVPVTLNATVQNDPSNSGVTWSVVSGSPAANCDGACGLLSNQTATSVTYTPPANVPASPNNTPTVIATSVADSTKSDSDGFTITSASANNNSELKGQYAFLINGFDDATGDHFAYIGSLTADGNGNITSGIEDVNLPSSSTGSVNLSITGTYTLGLDNRGTATVTSASGSSNFAFSVGAFNSGIATKLHIIEFDDSNGTSGSRGSGVAYLQNASAFGLASVTGPYAFQFVGQDAFAGDRMVNTGAFTASTGGGISGTVDSNLSNGGGFLGNVGLSGTVSSAPATATNGRLSFADTSATIGNCAFYIVSAGHLLSMNTDPETGASGIGLTTGEIWQQTSTSFTNPSLNGNVILYSTGVSTASGANNFVQAGLMTFNSANGSGTLSLDTNDGGTPGTISTTFTYTVASDGHVTINLASGSGPDLFLIDTNKAFMMDSGANINAGMIEPQASGSFSNSTVSGSYFLGDAEYQATTGGTVGSGIATSAGSGTVNATVDSSAASSPFLTSGQTLSLTLTVAPNGRATDNVGDIFYIISPTRLVLFGGADAQADIILGEQ